METLLQQFIKAFGWSILNSLWQSAIIYGILFIVMLSIPKLAAKPTVRGRAADFSLITYLLRGGLGQHGA